MASSILVTAQSKKEFLLNLRQTLELVVSGSQAVSTVQALLRQGCTLFEKDFDKFLPIDYSSDLKITSEKSQSLDQKEKTLLILEVLKLLLSIESTAGGDHFKKFDKSLALRNYFVKLLITDLGKEERESLFALVEHERPNQPDIGILKLYNELGSHILLEKIISSNDVESLCCCLQSFWEYSIKKNHSGEATERIVREIEEKLKLWLTSADREVAVNKQSVLPSFLKKKVVKVMKELDGEDLQGLFTVLNKGEIFNNSHLNNIMAFSCLRNWALYRLKNKDTGGEGIREYVLAYLMKIFEQIMRAYDSLVPIPELDNKEWVNFIEGVTCESLIILNILIETDESILMKLMDPLQKLWKRVLKKQQGFSILCFLELVLNYNKTLLLDPDVLFKEFFESHLYAKVHDELLCLKTLNFLSRKNSLLKDNTTIFQKYPRILFLIYIHNPSLYVPYMEKILPFIMNDQSLLAIFQLTLDLPLLCRLHTFDSFLQEKVLLIKSFDWLAPQYQQLIPYLNLQNQTLHLEDDYLNLLSKLHTETPSVIKENVLSGHLEALLKLVLSLIEDLENKESLMRIIKAILICYEHLFFEKDLKKRIKKILKDFIEKSLRANPNFLTKLSSDFIEYLDCYKNEEIQDLVMHLTWLVSEIIPSSFTLKSSSLEYKEWSKAAKSYCDHMEIILHQLIYFITLPVKVLEDENENKSGSIKTSAPRGGRIDELVCLVLGAMMKISVKYPMLKQNTVLIHLKLFGKKEDLPNIVNSKVVTNLKLLKNSTTTLLLFGNCI